MARYCSDCTYLKGDYNKKGIYKCSKLNKNISGCNKACTNFVNAYSRRNYEKEKIYDSSLPYCPTDNFCLPLYILIIIILIIAKYYFNI